MDYNREIGRLLGDFNFLIKKEGKKTNGLCANTGLTIGYARIVKDPKKATFFSTGDILICPRTTIEYLPLMKKSKAIITEQGNLLSHASIVARELNKPCLVSVKNATKKFKDGDTIFINASDGWIKKID